jgi:hypothetical protein
MEVAGPCDGTFRCPPNGQLGATSGGYLTAAVDAYPCLTIRSVTSA